MTTTPRIDFDRAALAALCRKHHIKRLAFFGSVLRDDFGPGSDVDILYEFEEGTVLGFNFIDVIDDFEAFFGRKVDFVPFKYINRRLRARILSEAQVQYEAA
jgi:predicted nucleotidyltransferase